MALFKCKMCGGDLAIAGGVTIAECEYCGTKQTVPKAIDENLQSFFNRANTLRLKSEFDKAAELYEKIIQADPTQSEAYWGLILCKYGIEYVDDPATLQKIPTCHRASYDSIIADDDYKSALENADISQRAIYEEQAKEIDRIQKEILALAQKEETYDVFICYKETDANGQRTQDSVIANDIYYQLTNEGFKVFYAAITLEGKLGSAYEPIIFAALNSAKVMLAIGTTPEHFNAVWVKNEWSRFLNIIKKDRSKLLIPCYRDMDPYNLPEEFSHLQAQDMAKIGFINDIVRGIKKVISKDEPKATTIVKETMVSSANANVAPLLKRAFMSLEDGEFDKADDFCEQVLNQDPENAQAYLGKLMAELHVKKQDSLKDCAEPFDNNNNFKKVLRFANQPLKDELVGYIEHINVRNENTRLENTHNRVKNAKRDWIIAFIAIIIVCALVAISIVGIFIKNDSDTELTANTDITFEELDKYNDSATNATESDTTSLNLKYNMALALMNAGNLDDAYTIFQELGNYNDSADKAKNIQLMQLKEQLNKIQAGKYITFGTYEQDNNTSNGKEAIEWLVLRIFNDGKALVISKYALDCQPYNESYMDVSWETCSLCTWLNTDFMNTAFSAIEKEVIPQVFLFSSNEVQQYYNSYSARQCEPTAYAIAQGALVNDVNGACSWWLSSPGVSQNFSALVSSAGGIHKSDVDNSYGVRPVMWIDLNSIK